MEKMSTKTVVCWDYGIVEELSPVGIPVKCSSCEAVKESGRLERVDWKRTTLAQQDHIEQLRETVSELHSKVGETEAENSTLEAALYRSRELHQAAIVEGLQWRLKLANIHQRDREVRMSLMKERATSSPCPRLLFQPRNPNTRSSSSTPALV